MYAQNCDDHPGSPAGGADLGDGRRCHVPGSVSPATERLKPADPRGGMVQFTREFLRPLQAPHEPGMQSMGVCKGPERLRLTGKR